MDLTAPVTSITGIGDVVANRLSNLKITTVFDFLYHLPFRYEDRRSITPAAHARIGDSTTIIGEILSLKNEFTRRRKVIQNAVVTDESGQIEVIWFNQSFLSRTLKPGMKVALFGKVDFFGRKKCLISPDYEIVGSELLHMARLVPIYPETRGISSKWYRTKIHQLLKILPFSDFLPPDIPASLNILNWQQALADVHFPKSETDATAGRRRLAFDELLLLQVLAIKRQQEWRKIKLTKSLHIDTAATQKFYNSLPFTLTASQTTTIDEILSDLSQPHPMNRLVEGDVGSGKTILAAAAAYHSHLNHLQTIILAPTVILAQQHFETLTKLFQPFGIKVFLVTASRKDKGITPNAVIVGTHALLSDKIELSNVGVVVIDEQHRFGVSQRAIAAAKGSSPHILTMTATPIPRTIALTLYGDLDLSVLRDMPPGRLPVKTWVVPESKREGAYQWIAGHVREGSQAFIVCPFIEESESAQSVRSAVTEHERLSKIFPQFSLGLLHGKLSAAQKNQVLNKFREGEYQILVATPVVEVGVDIPQASVIVVEDAHRFGLAQLHQLRGRVGRSTRQSYCLLFSSASVSRLKALETHNSGIELAEIDLKLRGPGEVYGTSQHGSSQFRIATYSDLDLIESSRQVAQRVLPRLSEMPLLHALIKQDKIDLVQPN